ncbi:MAG TPA: Uma2 family endonuclease [Candidatus Angelobacter sp.]|jgi:Uma2 family endonuclease|nr:Uma2 family endonuclease [Candidatus Angelobacter sp.]
MGTTTKLSLEEFQKLQDAAEDTVRYELDEGELIVTPSPTSRHNIVRYRLRRALTDFVQLNNLGLVLDETDFQLAPNVVRKPDIAFIPDALIHTLDLDHSPLKGAPALAVEVISPSNLAQDTVKKTRQYFTAGAQAVWLVYPALRLIEIHDAMGVRDVTEPDSLTEQKLFSGLAFSLSLAALFDENPKK